VSAPLRQQVLNFVLYNKACNKPFDKKAEPFASPASYVKGLTHDH